MLFTRLMMDQNVLRAFRFRINIVSVQSYLKYTYGHVVRYIFQVVCHTGFIYFPSSSRKVSHQYAQEETDFRYKTVELN